MAEPVKPERLSYNAGVIEATSGWPGWIWRTSVGPFELSLHIVSLGCAGEGEEETGIASFVVMEQEQPFLNYVAQRLAGAIAQHTAGGRDILLITVESKGAHLAPWVWRNLAEIEPQRLHPRIVTLRKGLKVYMRTPDMQNPVATIDELPVVLRPITYESITSSDRQKLAISPRDASLLYEALLDRAEPVLVDDFLGAGGTVIAVRRLFENLNRQLVDSGLRALAAPRFVAVVGSDGDLFERAFAEARLDVTALPDPLPLRLPTFVRPSALDRWQINI